MAQVNRPFIVPAQPSGKYLNLNDAFFDGTLDLAGDAIVEKVTANSNSFATADFTGCSAITFICMRSNGLSTVGIEDSPLLLSCDFSDNELDEAAVDGVLADLDSFGLSNGFVDVSGGTNAPPSAAGLTSKANLEGKGWTVTVNV